MKSPTQQAVTYTSEQKATLKHAGASTETVANFQEASIGFETALKCALSGVTSSSAAEFLANGVEDVKDMQRLESVYVRGDDIEVYRTLPIGEVSIELAYQLGLQGFISGHAKFYHERGVTGGLTEMLTLFKAGISADDYFLYNKWGFQSFSEMLELKENDPTVSGWDTDALAQTGLDTVSSLCAAKQAMQSNNATLHDVIEVRNELAIHCGEDLSKKLLNLHPVPKNIYEVAQESDGAVEKLAELEPEVLKIVVTLSEEHAALSEAELLATIALFQQ